LTGDDKIACEEAIEKAYKEALEDCSPEEPTECEQRFDAVYGRTMDQCLADGGTAITCQPVAEEAA
jgi:molybdopterin biosynthesis enzyme MoaB